MSLKPEQRWDYIAPFGDIIKEARQASDVVPSLTALTHALCGIGLELSQLNILLNALLETEEKDE
jgi:hypothetical protein